MAKSSTAIRKEILGNLRICGQVEVEGRNIDQTLKALLAPGAPSMQQFKSALGSLVKSRQVERRRNPAQCVGDSERKTIYRLPQAPSRRNETLTPYGTE